MKSRTYYTDNEDRVPYVAQTVSLTRTMLFQFFSVWFIIIGISYLLWRWLYSINFDALWFSLPLVIAETFMFFGSLLMIINYWNFKLLPIKRPVRYLSEISIPEVLQENDRPVVIDVFIATYNEDAEIVEDTIKDAKRLRYPFDNVKINIFLCDDGQRDGRVKDKENFKELAERYEIEYFVREDNKGYKAGNLNNAFWQTDGDLIVILDADTRVFPDFLIHLTGYFRDKKLAWVQSPQWFYDVPQGKKLSQWLISGLPSVGKYFSKLIPFSGKIIVGKNIFGTDPQIFYDSILRFRNAANAAFCCGAGSVHRRAALESLIKNQSLRLTELHSVLLFDVAKIKNKQLYSLLKTERMIVGPFVHHISEDIYTSILIHSDKEKWKSYQHPHVECRMLSPQSLSAYIKQFSRYAEGTFTIFFSKENPLIKKGLGILQRIAYIETIYSYFSPFWIIVFLLSPIIFFFTLTPPLKAFNFDFFLRFLIFNILNIVVTTIGNWGISTKRSEQYYISGFWFKLKAFFKVISGGALKFNPTAKAIQQEGIWNTIKNIIPQMLIIVLSLVGFIYNLILVLKDLHPSYAAFIANSIWVFYNLYQLNPIIRAAFRKPIKYS